MAKAKTYSDELLYHITEESNRIEREPITGPSFDNHWRATLLVRTAAMEKTLLHPRVLHQLLFEGLPNTNIRGMFSYTPEAGSYRLPKVHAYVIQSNGSQCFFTNPTKVPMLMETWWSKVEQAMWFGNPAPGSAPTRWGFHAWFETIHPFVDGNGRVGRLLWWNMTMIMDADIEIVTYDERMAYYERLEEWRQEHCNKPDMNPFR